MKSKADKILALLVIGLVFPSISNTNFNLSNEQKMVLNNPDISESYIDVNPIFINGTATGVGAHNWTWAVNQSWCSGNGIYSDPYIIENLKINGSVFDHGIEIWNSNVSFIIQDCLIYNSDYAIWIENVNNSRLIDNNCSNNNVGICIEHSNNNTISGNIANGNNQQGIYLWDSDHNYITENTVNDNDNGVEMDTSYDNYIGGNTVNNNTQNGIFLVSSDSNNITGNTASGNDYGIYLEDDCMNNAILGNNANNNNGYGIYTYNHCDYNTISNNTVNDNRYSGISLEYECYENIISENTINNSTLYGIYLYADCGYNTISNNFVNASGDYGITLHWYSQNNTIRDNKANYNGDIGIELYDYCENNTVLNNVISYNGLNGIGIYDYSDSNILTENLLYNNTIGVYIEDGDNNSIYENFFVKNIKHAFDGGVENNWNSTIIGNYWNNHTGPDISPQDGIVDNPYKFIDGPVGSADYLPIAEDGAPRITIVSPSEGERFSTAPTLNVEIVDIYVVEAWYTLDGGLNNYTFTGNGTINQTVWDALPEGSVNITFYANDIVGNIGFEEVTVIKDTSAEGLDPGVIAVIVALSIIGGVALFGAILAILIKKGKISIEKIKGFSLRRK